MSALRINLVSPPFILVVADLDIPKYIQIMRPENFDEAHVVNLSMAFGPCICVARQL
jgi:hypothetical protein